MKSSVTGFFGFDFNLQVIGLLFIHRHGISTTIDCSLYHSDSALDSTFYLALQDKKHPSVNVDRMATMYGCQDLCGCHHMGD